MPNTKEDINAGLGWLEKVLSFEKKYGMFRIIKSFVLLTMLSITIRICYNPSFIFEQYIEYSTKRHNKELVQRSEYDQELKSRLPVFLYKYHADRVWLIQYHNGIMDWQHGTMRFEFCNKYIPSVKLQYENFILSWLNLPYYLKEHDTFIGNLEEIYKIDPILHNRLEKNNISYLACVLIRDDNGYPTGIFGITWKEQPENIERVKDRIKNYLIEDRGSIKTLIQINKFKE